MWGGHGLLHGLSRKTRGPARDRRRNEELLFSCAWFGFLSLACCVCS